MFCNQTSKEYFLPSAYDLQKYKKDYKLILKKVLEVRVLKLLMQRWRGHKVMKNKIEILSESYYVDKKRSHMVTFWIFVVCALLMMFFAVTSDSFYTCIFCLTFQFLMMLLASLFLCRTLNLTEHYKLSQVLKEKEGS